jgi:DNA-binding SARP family transcriptional activator
VEFQVLGPVAVWDGGAPLDLGTPKARAALAVLLCRTGRVVGVDALVDALWTDAPPAAAVKNIQLYVHQLRRGLGEVGRIERREHGYLLAVGPGEVDAYRFEDLAGQHKAAVADGDLEQARELLTRALGLWRGEQAYAGIGDVPPVATEARRLAEARLAALQSRIDIDLRLGRHGDLVPELVALTGEHPLHERFWAQLMTALYRCGRQSEALAAHDNARRIIAEETGLDPGPGLRELQQAIMNADPSLDPLAITLAGSAHSQEPAVPAGPVSSAGTLGPAGPAASAGLKHSVVPRMLPSDAGDFTGRPGELAAITGALSDLRQPGDAAADDAHGTARAAALERARAGRPARRRAEPAGRASPP